MKIVKGVVTHGRFEIPYRIYGNGPDTMVCVSGAQQTMAVWRSMVSYFADSYRVVTFDFPGLGRSRYLAGPYKVSFEEQMGILECIVETAGFDADLTMVGSSWGTIIVAAYAARYPDDVDSLVLGSFGVKPSKTMLRLIKEGQSLYERGCREQAAHLIIDGFGQNITTGYKKAIIEQFRRMTDEQADTFYNHSGFVESVAHLEDLIDLSKIKARTLIINGADDTILDMEDMAVATSQIPNCESLIIEDVGHFLHFERPDILGIYAQFLTPEQPALP
ncbi:MAG: alpha/beta hydrolase [Gammaproteobacteria bacterium]|nr:alpha/beta hydrolase [Gammaproteobacteria bacterium]